MLRKSILAAGAAFSLVAATAQAASVEAASVRTSAAVEHAEGSSGSTMLWMAGLLALTATMIVLLTGEEQGAPVSP